MRHFWCVSYFHLFFSIGICLLGFEFFPSYFDEFLYFFLDFLCLNFLNVHIELIIYCECQGMNLYCCNASNIMEWNCFVKTREPNVLWPITDYVFNFSNTIKWSFEQNAKSLLNQSAISSFVVSSWYIKVDFNHCSISWIFLYPFLSHQIESSMLIFK